MKVITKERIISFFLICISGLMMLFSLNNISFAKAEEKTALETVELNGDTEYECENETETEAVAELLDLDFSLENYIGLGCNTSSCGNGRENGYSSAYFSTGCRNWQVMPVYTPFYRYYIDEDSFDEFNLSEENRQLFIENVHKAAEIWNSTRMHDGTGALVELIETEPSSSYVSGTNLCPIRYNPNLDAGTSGYFFPAPLHYIDIKEFETPGTILHEMGHLLGLQDLDLYHDSYTHYVLMGYLGDDELCYQDIQGMAVSVGKHTEHTFSRYALVDGKYKHVCFYCDLIDTQNSPLSGSLPFMEANSCTHNYLQMVSAGERHWLKCTKCYKVIETEWENDNEPNDGTIKYRKVNNSYYVAGRVGSSRNIVIPTMFNGKEVSAISSYAFQNTNIRSVEFEHLSQVESIGAYAFESCTYLTSIVLPSDLVSIGEFAFGNCSSLSGDILIPSGVTRIENYTFLGCESLDEVILSGNVTEIGIEAFADSGITAMDFPWSLSSIGNSAFKNCVNLQKIALPCRTVGDSAFENCTSLEEIRLWEDVRIIGSYAFVNCGFSSIDIPSTTESIGYAILQGCNNLTNLEVPFLGHTFDGTDSYRHFGYFFGTYSENLQSAYIPTSLKNVSVNMGTISDYAFYGCSSLENIILGDYTTYVTQIGDYAFYGCDGLINITIPTTVESIGEFAFYGCSSLTSVTLPSNLTTIESSAFYGCSDLTSVALPNSITSMGSSIFYGCSSLTSVTLPSPYPFVANHMFYGCSSLTSVTLPSTITMLQSSAFYGCSSLTNITFPSALTTISTSAFANSGLTSLTLPNTIDYIGASAFSGCSNLTKVYITGSEVISAGTNIFGASNNIQFIEVDTTALLSQYKTATNWSTYSAKFRVGIKLALVTDDTERAFAHCFDYGRFKANNIYDLSDSSWDYDDIEDSNVFGIVFFITTADGLSEISTGVGTTIPYEIVYGGEVSSSEAGVTMIATDYFSMGYNVMTSYLGNSSVADEAYSVSETLGYYPVIVGDWRLKYNGSFMMGLSYALGVPVKVNLGEDGFSTEEFNMANAEVSLENWLFVDVYDSTFLTQLSGSGVNVYLYGCNKGELLANEDFCAEVYLVESRVDYMALMNEAYRNNQTFVINSNWAFLEGADVLDSGLDDFYENGFEYACQELWELESYGLIDYNRWALLKSSYYAYPDSISSCVWVEQVVVVI